MFAPAFVSGGENTQLLHSFLIKKENPIFYWDESSQFNHLKGWLFLIVLDQLGFFLPWIVSAIHWGRRGTSIEKNYSIFLEKEIFLLSSFYFSLSKITEYLCSKTVIGPRIITGPQPTDRLRDPAPPPRFSKPPTHQDMKLSFSKEIDRPKGAHTAIKLGVNDSGGPWGNSVGSFPSSRDPGAATQGLKLEEKDWVNQPRKTTSLQKCTWVELIGTLRSQEKINSTTYGHRRRWIPGHRHKKK